MQTFWKPRRKYGAFSITLNWITFKYFPYLVLQRFLYRVSSCSSWQFGVDTGQLDTSYMFFFISLPSLRNVPLGSYGLTPKIWHFISYDRIHPPPFSKAKNKHPSNSKCWAGIPSPDLPYPFFKAGNSDQYTPKTTLVVIMDKARYFQITQLKTLSI